MVTLQRRKNEKAPTQEQGHVFEVQLHSNRVRMPDLSLVLEVFEAEFAISQEHPSVNLMEGPLQSFEDVQCVQTPFIQHT